jgi:hypothetical protein
MRGLTPSEPGPAVPTVRAQRAVLRCTMQSVRAIAIFVGATAGAALVACASAYSGQDHEPVAVPDASTLDVADSAIATETSVPTGDSAPMPACDLAQPFGAAVPLAELNDPAANDHSPRLTSDELTIVFGSNRAGGPGLSDIYISTRAKRGDPFAAPQLLGPLSSSSADAHPWISGDGLTILFARALSGNDYDIYRAVRASAGVAFGLPEKLDVSLPSSSDLSPFLGPSGDLWFASDRDGMGGVLPESHVWRAAAIAGGFAAPARISSGAADTDIEYYPTLSADGLTLFTARKAKSLGRTDFDVLISTRPASSAAFAAFAPLPGFASTAAGELPGWLSADGCRLYHMRIDPTDQPDLYVASRP